VLREIGLDLDRRASLWAYFVGLSVRFIKTGGRMAWVLPSSFIHANYSRNLRVFLSSQFARVRAFELQERQFLLEGTEERTIVVLADDRLSAPKRDNQTEIDLVRCSGVRDLALEIQLWKNGNSRATSSCSTAVIDCLSRAPRELFEKLKDSKECKVLSDFVRIQIGLVTGNNRFFLRTEGERLDAFIPIHDVTQILPRFTFVKGAEFTALDAEQVKSDGGKTFLISEEDPSVAPPQIRNYLASYPEEQKARCSTFKKRSSWSLTDRNATQWPTNSAQ
jgi:hypothetical protein